jgi:hypothetical protein
MHVDVMIEIVVVADKTSGNSRVNYLSDIVSADDAMDIYVSETSKSIALYHHSSYDAARRLLRDTQQMQYPDATHEKLILVGQVARALQIDAATQLEVSRAPLRLKAIPLDEW